MIKFYSLPVIVFLTFAALNANAQVDSSRNSYSILKPMPKSLLREDMETDRPNVTETPYTIEAGHIQYEADFVNYERQYTGGTLQRTWLVNQANLKLGLLKNTALQVIIQSYGRQITEDLQTNSKDAAHGFGDITLRFKQNIYGNYNGSFSIALMPYIKFPTNHYSDNQSYEEGLMVPMVLKLADDWKIGLQVEGDRLKDDEGDAMHTEILQSLVLSHILFNKLEVMGETHYTYNFKDHHLLNYLNAALELEIIRDVKIDVGLNYGLQHDARKNYFAGIAFRY